MDSCQYYPLNLPFPFKIMANLPHIALGAGALIASLNWEQKA